MSGPPVQSALYGTPVQTTEQRREGPVHPSQHHPPPLSFPLSSQFDSEFQFNSSVKTLLSRLPKQRYLESICDELHRFKIAKKYVASPPRCTRGSGGAGWVGSV